MKQIDILVPCYNEEAVLPQFYERTCAVIDSLRNYAFTFIFVNDGSRDRTLPILRQLHEKDRRVAYVSLSRNFGKEAAMLAGMDYAEGDALVIMDADLQDKRCVKALCSLRECQRYTKGLFCWIGFEKKEILFDRPPRAAGKTKWNYWKLFNLAIDGITSFTTAPLHIAAFVGCFFAFVAAIYLIFIVLRTLLYGEDVPGYPSLISLILFIGGVQFTFMGILGEYVGRIYNESKGRPPYIVGESTKEKK